MTSVEKSREWADVVLLWLHQASSQLRYLDEVCEQIQDMSPIAAFLAYGKTKSAIRSLRDQELEKYLNHRKC